MYTLIRDGVGSSPLTRGKRELPGCGRVLPGLIPAHAGKTRSPGSAAPAVTAHPRSRGENLRLYGLGAMNEGSSPLTRGKRPVWPEGQPGVGLIPAHAGKTGVIDMVAQDNAAHPRSRGENHCHDCIAQAAAGSSPLTRGKLDPSRVGVTIDAAHPRSRGENFGPSPKALRLPGSSPLTRGKRVRPRWRRHPRRLIPAHAGKT